MSRWLPIPAPASWQHDPARLRQFLAEHHLTGDAAGALIGVRARTIRRWTDDTSKSKRAMPYAAWYCLVDRAPKPQEQAP